VNSGAARRALRVTLIALALLRLAALLHPSMFAWGLNAGRFAAPPAAVALWLALALPLVPPVGRWLDSWLDASSARRVGPVPPAGLAALGAALLVLALPDRVWFVGDFLLRQATVYEPAGFRGMFPQAQPLDVLLHYRLPRALLAAGIAPESTARAVGAVEAATLVLLAARLARGLGLAGASGAAAGAIVACGGYLALDAGYTKPTLEVVLLTVAIGVFGVEAVRSGRGLLGLSLLFAAALGFHRSALSLAPGVAAFVLLALSRHREALRRVGTWLAGLVLAATLAWFIPRLWRLFVSFDAATNFTSVEVQRQGGMWRSALRPLRLMDLANLVLLWAPLAAALPAAAWTTRAEPGGRERLGLALLAAGFLPALLLVYVTQGPFRDWDANAAAGAALALLAAAVLAPVLAADRARGLASAALLGVLAPTVLLLVSQNDLERGLARARAFLSEPPARTESQRLATLDYLGLRLLQLRRWGESADAFARLAADAPHPRALVLEGTAALLAGRAPHAEASFLALVRRDSTQSVGWFGLWLAARRAGDERAAREAGGRVQSYPDTGAAMEAILAHLQHYPDLWSLMPRDSSRTGLTPARDPRR
jgi:hypothetical protein